jgi:hypothetical protein
MINWLHLLWIIPISASIGAFGLAVIVGGSNANRH